jgi:hypothetical protein
MSSRTSAARRRLGRPPQAGARRGRCRPASRRGRPGLGPRPAGAERRCRRRGAAGKTPRTLPGRWYALPMACLTPVGNGVSGRRNIGMRSGACGAAAYTEEAQRICDPVAVCEGAAPRRAVPACDSPASGGPGEASKGVSRDPRRHPAARCRGPAGPVHGRGERPAGHRRGDAPDSRVGVAGSAGEGEKVVGQAQPSPPPTSRFA